MAISPQLLQEVFRGTRRHMYYARSVEMFRKMRVHFDGDYPELLIEERRPGEEAQTQEYRKKIWVPITMEPLAKVESSLQKIRKSADWSVRHKPEATSAKINKDEIPELYFEKKYPVYGYVGGWLFSEVVRNYIIDANSYVAILPTEEPEDKATYIKPYPHIFNSDRVLYVDDECAIFSADPDDEKDMVTGELKSDSFWVFTKEAAALYLKDGDGYKIVREVKHMLGYVPVFKMRGIYLDSEGKAILHRSRFYAMCPRLDEAAREYSDLQAEIVQHIHSESWEIKFPDCKQCKGTGKTIATSGGFADCKQCKGSGYDASPYSRLTINANQLGAANVPVPPKGYVDKKTDIAKLQDERVEAHIYRALSAVNFQFLAQVPMKQSGIAKEVDRDELNNTVHSVAEDLVHIMEQVYAISIDMRYGQIVPDAEARKMMRPDIAVPERYDLLNAGFLMDEMKQAKDSGASPAIIAEMQIELANKKFYNNPEVMGVVQLVYELDPLPGYEQDDKMAAVMSGLATKEDAIISNYLASFVRRAIIEDAKFAGKTYAEKIAKMKEYASEKMPAPLAIVTIQPTDEG